MIVLCRNEKRYKKLEDWVQNRDRHWSEIESIKQMIDDQVVDAMDSAKVCIVSYSLENQESEYGA